MRLGTCWLFLAIAFFVIATFYVTRPDWFGFMILGLLCIITSKMYDREGK